MYFPASLALPKAKRGGRKRKKKRIVYKFIADNLEPSRSSSQLEKKKKKKRGGEKKKEASSSASLSFLSSDLPYSRGKRGGEGRERKKACTATPVLLKGGVRK